MKDRTLTILAGTLLATTAAADVDVDKRLDAAPDGFVEISNVAGLVEVRGWSERVVEVKGTLGDDVEELIFERDGDRVLIKVKVPRRHGRDIDADLFIRLPERSSVEISGVSADIEIEGVLGELSLQTVSGDVEARDVSADFEAASVSGDVTVTATGKDADTEAGTVSGDVSVSNAAGTIEVGSVSGDVTVAGGSFDSAELETVNGDVEFVAELRKGGDLSIESVNGGVDVEFRGPVSARFDVETFNGAIRNCFGPKPERTSRYSPGLGLSFTEGDGDGRVAIETLNGSIRICNR
ncbi:MAG: DUF4097 family beta strand repeat-containing protein [Woeseiaceae bacterium]|nr:DUF4097 family beta strand repeat-containing protein [Woeseiaceae bacterium]